MVPGFVIRGRGPTIVLALVGDLVLVQIRVRDWVLLRFPGSSPFCVSVGRPVRPDGLIMGRPVIILRDVTGGSEVLGLAVIVLM